MDTAGKTLFFITPLGSQGSAERHRADWVHDQILGPVCADLGITLIRADRIDEATSLVNRILGLVLGADFAVCDFAFGKPNVYYECGIRHCTGKPTVHLARRDEPLPFDVKDFLTVFTDENQPGEAEETRRKIKNMLVHADGQTRAQNPVTIAAGLAGVEIRFKDLGSRKPVHPAAETTVGPRNWSGTWLTNFGLVQVRQAGARLTGAYQFHSDRWTGLFAGRSWKTWVLAEFKVKDTAYPGMAFVDTGAREAYGYWVHTPEVPTLEVLKDRLDRDPGTLAAQAKRWKVYGRVQPDGTIDADLAGPKPGGLVEFYLHGGTDPGGRTLDDLLRLDDRDLSTTADYLPWLFPDYGAEGTFPGLGLEELSTLKRSAEFRDSLKKAFTMVLRYYGFNLVTGGAGVRVEKSDQYEARKRDWIIVNHFHHHRITRILRVMSMYDFIPEARGFYAALLKIQKHEYRWHLRVAVKYWRLAVGLDRK